MNLSGDISVFNVLRCSSPWLSLAYSKGFLSLAGVGLFSSRFTWLLLIIYSISIIFYDLTFDKPLLLPNVFVKALLDWLFGDPNTNLFLWSEVPLVFEKSLYLTPLYALIDDFLDWYLVLTVETRARAFELSLAFLILSFIYSLYDFIEATDLYKIMFLFIY